MVSLRGGIQLCFTLLIHRCSLPSKATPSIWVSLLQQGSASNQVDLYLPENSLIISLTLPLEATQNVSLFQKTVLSCICSQLPNLRLYGDNSQQSWPSRWVPVIPSSWYPWPCEFASHTMSAVTNRIWMVCDFRG